jgi:hypothetical protein
MNPIAFRRGMARDFAHWRTCGRGQGAGDRLWQDKSAGLRRAHVVGGTGRLGRRSNSSTGALLTNTNEFNDPTAVAGH